MGKFLIYGLIISLVLCVLVNGTAFFAEKIFKKKTVEKFAKKERE